MYTSELLGTRSQKAANDKKAKKSNGQGLFDTDDFLS